MEKATFKPSLYLHIPFCKHICGYCDFAKVIYNKEWSQKYLEALKKELDSYHIDGIPYSIYVGGGTPTSLDIEELKILLDMIDPYVLANSNQEYTFESNVETLTKEKLLLLKKHGVNRLSIGVESTDDEILKKLNRHHTYEDIKTNIALAREFGFDNISVDLILALPFADIDNVKKDIDNLLKLNPDHISTYSLTIEEHTDFHNKGYEEKDDELVRLEYDYVHNTLLDNGFIHYEISNFAKPGHESKHNMQYWRNKHYYGVGLGAAGYLANRRYTNTRNLNKYLQGDYIAEEEEIAFEDELSYHIMLNLRTNEGIVFDEVNPKFNIDFMNKYKDLIDNFKEYGLIDYDDRHLFLTYEGMMLEDRVTMALFMKD